MVATVPRLGGGARAARHNWVTTVTRPAEGGPLLSMTEATFDQQLAASPKPLLVDFWLEGCGPCAEAVPVLAEIAAEHGDSLSIAEARLDDAPGLATRFEIMALPTLILFVDGHPVKRLDWTGSKAGLLAGLAEFLYLP